MKSTQKQRDAQEIERAQAEYEAWRDEQIRLGMEDLDAGRVVDHETLMARLKAKIKRLEKKHAQAA